MLSAILPLLRIKWLPWALAGSVIASGAIWLHGYYKGHERGQNEKQAELDAFKAESSARSLAMQSEYRLREQELQANVQEISDELNTQLDQTKTDYIVALDASRSNAFQLREQWQSCAANRLSSAASDPATASGDDDSSANGLPAEAIQPFLLVGRDANLVANRLIACQKYVNSIQNQ